MDIVSEIRLRTFNFSIDFVTKIIIICRFIICVNEFRP